MSFVGDYDDDDDSGDLLFFAFVIAGAYFGYQYYRSLQAASYGGGIFQPSAPDYDEAQGILSILVPLSVSSTGISFIKSNEGLRLAAYPDGSGQSIGWGHHIQPGENIISPITNAEAEGLFARDLATAEKAVNDGLQVQVSQNQYDALVDFAYNVGRGAFLNSTLLRLLNAGDYSGAAAQFHQWANPGRRQADANLFNGA